MLYLRVVHSPRKSSDIPVGIARRLVEIGEIKDP